MPHFSAEKAFYEAKMIRAKWDGEKDLKLKYHINCVLNLRTACDQKVPTGEVGASYSLGWDHTCRNKLST